MLGASTGIFAILLHSVVDFNLHIPANAILAVTLMALITGHLRFATDRFWVSQRLKGRLLATLILLPAIAYLASQAAHCAGEQWWLHQAQKHATDPALQRVALTKAFACEPRNFETAYTLAESLRQESWLGTKGWDKLAEAALPWYETAFALNPYDPYDPYDPSIPWALDPYALKPRVIPNPRP